MKILIDVRPLQTYSKFRGIGRYTNLLVQLFGSNKDCYFLLFNHDVDKINVKNKIIIKTPRRGITITDQFVLPIILKKYKIDIYHSTAYALPPKLKNVKYIFTFFDITPLKFPAYSSKKNLIIYKKILKSISKADKIITISEMSKSDLSEYLKLDKAKIDVIYPALDNINKGMTLNKLDIKNIIPDNFILYVGGFDGNKNVETILKAVNLIDYPLLLVGAISNKKKSELLQYIDENKKKQVIFLGYLSDNDLKYCYKKATVFLFPSLYEGFGFPPLEALQYDTVSIVSKCGSLPEVLENAALFLDNPLDYKELALTIQTLAKDKNLRNEIIIKGEKVLKKYSLINFKNKMESLYLNLYN